MSDIPCFECFQPSSVRHHVVPRSRGGKNTVPLCDHCHGLAHGVEFSVLDAERPRILTDENIDRIVSAYQSGDSSNLLADMYGVSPATIRYWLKKRGVETRPRGRLSKTALQKLDRLRYVRRDMV